MQQQGKESKSEVTWEDQQNINKFGRLNNRLHDLDEEIKIAKTNRVVPSATINRRPPMMPKPPFISHHSLMEANENLEDASNELILTDEVVVRFQVGEVFAHMSNEEVESRIEEMKEATNKNLKKMEEEKESVVAQMAELKKILYGKFKDSINLEED